MATRAQNGTSRSQLGTPEINRFASKYKYLPYINLVYLLFLCMPFFFYPKFSGTQILVTLTSIAIFLPLYFLTCKKRSTELVIAISAILLLCFLVMPYNYGANTYLIYGVIAAAHTFKARNAIVCLIAALLVLAIQSYSLGLPVAFYAATAIMACMLVFYTIYHLSLERSNQILLLSQQEVQRLAQAAERERIGRDLHDVLGHTLSLIVMKSELASRLFERDPNAAIGQIREVEKIARDALGQIRIAVAGIRLAGLEAELANARLSLLSADIQLHYQLTPVELASEIETVLALAVREAVTNIIRHSNAGKVEIDLSRSKNRVRLQISDDGKSSPITPGQVTPGHGLTGMRERLELLGGRLEIDTGAHGGVRLSLSCPIPEAKALPAALANLVTQADW